MKQMWIDCALCDKRVRNCLNDVRRHATACAGAKVEEAQRVAVGAVAERNALRVEVARLRAELEQRGAA